MLANVTELYGNDHEIRGSVPNHGVHFFSSPPHCFEQNSLFLVFFIQRFKLHGLRILSGHCHKCRHNQSPLHIHSKFRKIKNICISINI